MTSDRKRQVILCIEDDPDILEELREELGWLGYAVLTVSGPDEAEHLLASVRPDLILCDIVMPGRNGIDFLVEMRKSGKLPVRVPFLFLSALSDRDTRLHALGAGADDYMTKPIDLELLQVKVRNMLDFVDRLTARRPAPSPSCAIHLSPREEQVLRELGQGARTATIAYELGISEHTVNQYIKHLYRKIGASNRAEAVRHAIARGLVQPEL
ncbi:response regulator transcription factor [Pseudooceanicola nanhaiensis]|uniref:response regulator transcription factor n=1 Tax=Pseudooceanicola nanhaiensis TaxID=375761 RepID=UPI001CD3694B|nr:response regulator transcription factor [Pseudooceanicola nanhaiensis]MCA0921989.1 response regulator transcription factor [Pseudooceanicola nanhaiensis]